jgi:hypothetical protein
VRLSIRGYRSGRRRNQEVEARLALTSCLCVACRERILLHIAAEFGRHSFCLHVGSVWAFDMGGLKHHFTPCTEEKYINLPQFLIRSMFCLRNRIIKSTSSFCVELTYRTTAKVRIADVPRKLRTTQRPRLSAWHSRRGTSIFVHERAPGTMCTMKKGW